MIKLYKKMFEVMKESNGLMKDMRVANQYNAVSEKMMLNEVKPLLKKHGLIIFPIETIIDEKTKGNKSITQVNVRYKIVDIDSGESEILSGVGNGADTQDKGAGKAFTYAYKAMLSKTFMLFSGEDTDNDHSDTITKQQQEQEEEERQRKEDEALETGRNHCKAKLKELGLKEIYVTERFNKRIVEMSINELRELAQELKIKKDNKGMI